MTTSRLSRRVRAAALALPVAAGVLTPLATGSASAATLLPAPAGTRVLADTPKGVVLDWSPVSGAAGYRVEVDTDGEWSDDAFYSADTVASRFTLPAWLPHADYVWRVTAKQTGGHGRWSTTGQFSRSWTARPTPLSPGADQAVTGRPTFTWTPVPTASEYQVQVSTSPLFDAQSTGPTYDNDPTQTQASPKTESCFTTRTRVTPFTGYVDQQGIDAPGDCFFTLLGTGEARYWRVRALDQYVTDVKELPTTPSSTEGISHLPPNQDPESHELTKSCPTQAATTSPQPGDGGDPSPSASASASPSASPSASAAAQDTCEPSHKVEKGPWSPSVRFTSSYPSGNAQDLRTLRTTTVPVDQGPDASLCVGTLCKDFPTLSWAQASEQRVVDGAPQTVTVTPTRYRVYVGLDAAFSNIQRIVETSALQWTPTDQWRQSTPTQSYYYVVQACTDTGCGEPSEVKSFRVSSVRLATSGPGRVLTAAELAGDPGALSLPSVGGQELLLSWQDYAEAQAAATGAAAVSEAAGYRVQVTTDENPDFQSTGLVDQATVDATHHVSPTKLYPEGVLLWRVQAVDASGRKLPWSQVRAFRYDRTRPTVTLVPSTNVAVKGVVKMVFSEPVKGVASRTSTTAPGTVSHADGATRGTLTPKTVLVPGASYAVSFAAGITDAAGNALVPVVKRFGVNPVADDRSPALAYAGTWRRLLSSNATAGTYTGSTPRPLAQTAVTFKVFGTGVDVTACKGPANGLVDVYVDGVRKARVDTYRSFSGCGQRIALVTGLAKGEHRVQVRGIGQKRAASRGTNVAVDAIRAVP